MRAKASLRAAVLCLLGVGSASPPEVLAEAPDIRLFMEAAARDEKQAREALDRIASNWRDPYAALIVDIARLLPAPRRPRGADEAPRDPPPDEGESASTPRPGGQGFAEVAPVIASDPRSQTRERLIRFLEKQTGQSFGQDLRRWRQWIWKLPYEPHPQYGFFKAALYSQIDPRMAEFFPPGVKSLIRLDEVDWGGVKVNGIPPLDHPKHVLAREATYLKDKNIVFGVVLNGEARAYPKRILAWHEMARDKVGGVELAIVYCTLCGTVIPYGGKVGGALRTFGTSGLLYRSNKLMFDQESMSLWSALDGRPVIGKLAGSGLELLAYPVVTTTWREWVAEHPDTTVVSLETGFERDYSEGAAYRDYFATDRLMFEVPKTDPRLKNKDEVLTLLLRAPGAGPEAERQALAISTGFLKKNPVHQLSFAGHDLVVVTSGDGANRVYDAAGTRFARRRDDRTVVDDKGQPWQVMEEALLPAGRDEPAKRRVPARRAFWFGWYAQFPQTELVR